MTRDRVEEAENYENKPEVEAEWVPDGCSQVCMQCGVGFWFLRRRHHCRGCGWLLCDECSSYRQPLETIVTPSFGRAPGEAGKLYRVCSACKSFGVDMKKTMDILNVGGKITSGHAEQIWSNYDEDGDGTLSKAELRHVLTDCLNSQKAALQSAANRAHTEASSELTTLLKDHARGANDRSGSTGAPDVSKLTPALEELAGLASTLAIGLVSQCVATIDNSLTPAGLDSLVDVTYARLDVDGDGRVTKDEFVNLIGELLSPPGLDAAYEAFDICRSDGHSGNASTASAPNCNVM
eukprot:COSAG02_NODE_9930_length_2071_cov_2.506592_2_plen_294_part_00